jgi:1-phosphofructokinase family hexose kinase
MTLAVPILCVGTTPALARTMRFRSLALDAVNRTGDVYDYAAGKAVNVARVVKTLGGRPTCTGFLGGPRGGLIRDDLDRLFIAHDFVEVDALTRLCITVVDDTTNSATELVEDARPVASHDAPNLLNRLSGQLESSQANVVVMSGSLAPGVGDDFYARCIDRATDAGAMTVVDASGPALIRACEAGPTAVKVNAMEFCRSFQIEPADESELIERIRAAAESIGAWIIVTRGPAPVWASDGADFITIETPAVEVVSPIGSGDAFTGGLALALGRGDAIDDAMRLGVACASANAMTPHAGHVDRAAVESLFKTIRVEG